MQWLQTLLDSLLSALTVYGLVIVFLATMFENLFVVGSFFPGDVLTAAAAFAASTAHGRTHLSIWTLLVAATLGTLLGMNISYFIGRVGGEGLIRRLGPRLGISIEVIEAGEEYFERYGAATILLARFIAVLKNISSALAGAARMRIVVFEFFALLASLGYAGILLAVGWFLGENFRAGLKYFGAFSWLAFVGVVAAVVLVSRGKRRHDLKLVAKNAARFEAEHEAAADDDA